MRLNPLATRSAGKSLRPSVFSPARPFQKTELVVEVELQPQSEEHVTATAKLAETTPLTHDVMRVVWETDLPMHYRALHYLNMCRNGGPVHRSYFLATAPEKSGQTRPVTFLRHGHDGAFIDVLERLGPDAQAYLCGDRCSYARAGAAGRAA